MDRFVSFFGYLQNYVVTGRRSGRVERGSDSPRRTEEENKVVKIAKAVTEDDEDRKEQRKRLNELVREIDKCIALLNN